jgi:hypothetical protein
MSNRHVSTPRRHPGHRPLVCGSFLFGTSSERLEMSEQPSRQNILTTCLAIGNSYAQVLQAHLLYPVWAEMMRRFAQLGQNNITGR